MAIIVDFTSTVAEDPYLNVQTVFQFFMYILSNMVMGKNFWKDLMIRMFLCQDSLHQGPQIFQKSRSHLQILGTITVT